MNKTTKKQIKSKKTNSPPAEQYLYSVGWSEKDEAFVARVAEFPSLAAHGETSGRSDAGNKIGCRICLERFERIKRTDSRTVRQTLVQRSARFANARIYAPPTRARSNAAGRFAQSIIKSETGSKPIKLFQFFLDQFISFENIRSFSRDARTARAVTVGIIFGVEIHCAVFDFCKFDIAV